jgi:hypothetical protein
MSQFYLRHLAGGYISARGRPSRGCPQITGPKWVRPRSRSSPARCPSVLWCGRPPRTSQSELVAASPIPRHIAGTSPGLNCVGQHPQRRLRPRWAQGWGGVGRSRSWAGDGQSLALHLPPVRTAPTALLRPAPLPRTQPSCRASPARGPPSSPERQGLGASSASWCSFLQLRLSGDPYPATPFGCAPCAPAAHGPGCACSRGSKMHRRIFQGLRALLRPRSPRRVFRASGRNRG